MTVRVKGKFDKEPVEGVTVLLMTPFGQEINGINTLSSKSNTEGIVSWENLPAGSEYRIGADLDNPTQFYDMNPDAVESSVLREYKEKNSEERLVGRNAYRTDISVLSEAISIPEKGETSVEIILDTKTEVKGTVELFGEPVKGVHVELKKVQTYIQEEGPSMNDWKTIDGDLTDDRGVFSFIGPAEGSYNLHITYQDDTGDVFLKSEEINVKKGEVTDLGLISPTNEPPINVDVRLKGIDTKELQSLTGSETVRGRIQFKNWPQHRNPSQQVTAKGIIAGFISTPRIPYEFPNSFQIHGVRHGRLKGYVDFPPHWSRSRALSFDNVSGNIFVDEEGRDLDLTISVEKLTEVKIEFSGLGKINIDNSKCYFISDGKTHSIPFPENVGQDYRVTRYLPLNEEANNRFIILTDPDQEDGTFFEKNIDTVRSPDQKRVHIGVKNRQGASIIGNIHESLIPEHEPVRESVMIFIWGPGAHTKSLGPTGQIGTFSVEEDGTYEIHNLPPNDEVFLRLRGQTIRLETGIRGSTTRKNINE